MDSLFCTYDTQIIIYVHLTCIVVTNMSDQKNLENHKVILELSTRTERSPDRIEEGLKRRKI